MQRSTLRVLGAVAVAAAIFGLMALAIRATDPWSTAADGPSGLGESDAQLDATTKGLFDTHVLAFEVLGILLTAAMIGALVVARPLAARADSENYSHPTREQIAESRHQSDVRTHLPEGPQ